MFAIFTRHRFGRLAATVAVVAIVGAGAAIATVVLSPSSSAAPATVNHGVTVVGVSAAGASTEAEHLSAELGFEVLVPGNPPAGYILRSVSKSVLGGLEIADFRYVDDTGSGGGSNVDVQEINTRLTQPPMVSGSTPSVVADPALPWANVMVSRGPSGGATVYAIRSGDRTFVVAIDRGNALTLSAVNSMAAPFVAAVS